MSDPGTGIGAKSFWMGTHRVVDPEVTLARVMPFAPRMGVTRVAVQTGLDNVGIPVAAAVRPNSRSIAVHQGKGCSLAAAKASAIMEAAELFHAENIRLPLRLASFGELRENVIVADPSTLARTVANVPDDQRLLWIKGRDVLSGAAIWVPHELVSTDFTAPVPPGSGFFQATSNGLAAGNHRLEAVLHGLYEAIERDAVALWRCCPSAHNLRLVDPASIDGSLSCKMLSLFLQTRIAVSVWDITSDIGLPTFLCLAMPDEPAGGLEPELGSGCHADRDVALARALSEAAQARVARISGARDDFPPQGYGSEARAARLAAAHSWQSSPACRHYHATSSWTNPTLRQDLDLVLACLAKVGLQQVIWVDLTRPELGIPVGRAIVPGLEGPWTSAGEGYIPGVRARAAMERR
jgi:ribosomal protein S12 methylthiotransferase accessory factor